MRKKILPLLALFVMFILSACQGSRMSGQTTTVCVNAPSTIGGIGETIVTIEGDDEQIIRWIEQTTFDRLEYESYFWGGYEPTEEDIRNWFEGPMNQAPDGISWALTYISETVIKATLTYDYLTLDEATLNDIWQTQNFFEDVSVSSAIAGLREDGATCD